MVGQIYKDSKLAWLVYFIIIYIVSTTALICASMINESDYQTIQFTTSICFCIGSINMIVSLITLIISMQADEQTKWLNFALTLPGGMKSYVKSKFAFSIIMMVAMSILSVIVACICDLVEPDGNITGSVFMVIAVSAGVGMICTAIYAPICFIWGATKGERVLNIILVMIVVAFYCYMMFGDIAWMEGDIMTKLMNFIIKHISDILIVTTCVFTVGIILMYLSYKFIIFAYEKGWCRLYED